MAELDYNEIRERKVIMHNDEPCVVVSSHVARTQMRKPTNQTKLKSLMSGKVFQVIFQATDSAEEADIAKKQVKYLYADAKKNEYWFCDADDASNRFTLGTEVVGDQMQWVKPNQEVSLKVFINDEDEEVPIGIDMPIKQDFVVTEAPPNVKGDTATGGTKTVTLETGAQLRGVPLFVVEGDVVRVNTETSEYVERVTK
jgi:elongation factor P